MAGWRVVAVLLCLLASGALASTSVLPIADFLQWSTSFATPNIPLCRSLSTLQSLTITNTSSTTASCSALLLFGGFFFPLTELIGGGQLLYTSEFWVFHTAVRRWINFSIPGPPARGGHLAGTTNASDAAFNHFIFGGTTAFTTLNDTWIVALRKLCQPPMLITQTILASLASWTRLTPVNGVVPPSRWGAAGALLQGRIVVFGGFADPLTTVTASIFPAIHNETFLWVGTIDARAGQIAWQTRTCARTPSPRAGMEFAKLSEGRLVIVSGVSFESTLASSNVQPTLSALHEVHVLDFTDAACSWTLLSPVAAVPSNTSLYPFPYVVFGAATSMFPTSMILYGGVQRPFTFFSNANLNAASNNFVITYSFDFVASTFSWQNQSFSVGNIARSYFPAPRGNLAVAMAGFDNIVTVFGGFSSYVTECTSSHFATEVINEALVGRIWEYLSPFYVPPNIYQPAVTTVADENNTQVVMVVGGQLDSNSYENCIPVWNLEVEMGSLNTWQQYPDLKITGEVCPVLRWAQTVNFYGPSNILVMFGGMYANSEFGDLTASNELWVCQLVDNLGSLTWFNMTSAVSPPARSQHTAVLYADFLFVYGGFPTSPIMPALEDVWMLDVGRIDTSNVSSVNWILVQPVSAASPVGRGAHVASWMLSPACSLARVSGPVLPGAMVIYSGSRSLSSTSTLKDVWCLQVIPAGHHSYQGLWTKCEDGPPARQGAASATSNASVWMVAGGLSSNNSALSDTWVYVDYGWHQINSTTLPPVYNHALAVTMVANVPYFFVLGGIARTAGSVSDGQALFVDFILGLECMQGMYKFADTALCVACPIGTWNNLIGMSSCQPCKNSVLTNQTMSTSIEFCNVCSDDVSCNGRGKCFVDPTTSIVSCTCTGWYRWSDSDRCSTPVVAIIVICIFIAIICAVAVFLGVRHYRRTRAVFASKEMELSTMLLERQNQVDELSNAWVVDPRDLHLQELLGSGATGEVYAATWREMRVAVKTVSNSDLVAPELFWNDIENEISLLRTIRHPNIVLFFGAGNFHDKTPFIVTELMERGTLTSVLEAGPIDWATKTRYAGEVAAGMAYLHNLHRIHRDLKSSNLLVSRSDHVKVADFGTGALVRPKTRSSLRHRASNKRRPTTAAERAKARDDAGLTEMIGTPLWMAPEILAGEKYGPAVDLYSYGIVLWEIAAQTEPWPDLSDRDLMLANLLAIVRSGRRPVIDPSWPADYVVVMTQCWDSDPLRRGSFESVCEQWAAIAAASNPDKRLSVGNMLRHSANRTSLVSLASHSGVSAPATSPPMPLEQPLVELPANARASLIDEGGSASIA